MKISEIKKEARENLKGKWKKTLLITTIFYIITLLLLFGTEWLVSQIQYGIVVYVLYFLILVSLNYGVTCSFVKIKRNEEVSYLDFLIYAIRDNSKVLKSLGKILLKMAFYILLILVCLYLLFVEVISYIYGYGITLMSIVEALGFLIVSILFCRKILHYSLKNYLIYDYNEKKIKEILQESETLMKNNIWKFIKLEISFLGWILLTAILTLGILVLVYYTFKINNKLISYVVLYASLTFITPYIQIANICFYDSLKSNKNIIENQKLNIKKKKKNK